MEVYIVVGVFPEGESTVMQVFESAADAAEYLDYVQVGIKYGDMDFRSCYMVTREIYREKQED